MVAGQADLQAAAERWALISVTFANTVGASARVALDKASRSPPAKKVFFADVTMTPVSSSFAATS